MHFPPQTWPFMVAGKPENELKEMMNTTRLCGTTASWRNQAGNLQKRQWFSKTKLWLVTCASHLCRLLSGNNGESLSFVPVKTILFKCILPHIVVFAGSKINCFKLLFFILCRCIFFFFLLMQACFVMDGCAHEKCPNGCTDCI